MIGELTARNSELAKRIAADLFTNGSAEHADTLRMHTESGKYLGGWCEGAAADVICRHLDKPRGVWMTLCELARRNGKRVSSLSRSIERNGGVAPGLEIERRPPVQRGKRGKIVRVRAGDEFFQWLKVTQKGAR